MAFVGHVPNLRPVFFNSFKINKNREQAIEAVMNAKDDFVVEEGKESLILYPAEYIAAHPNSRMSPVIKIKVKDNEGEEGTTVDYELDLQKNVVSVVVVWTLFALWFVAVVWGVLSIFSSFNLLGAATGISAMIICIMLIKTKMYEPHEKMLAALKKITGYVGKKV